MSIRYFEEEMRYLQEAGKAFAESFPDKAYFLNIESISDRDPYVERLFEGFAFLSGKVHERLDDDMPEYTDGLFNLLWPHYLRAIPALSIIELSPKKGILQETFTFDKNTEVHSKPVGNKNIKCPFRMTQSVTVHPMKLEDATLSWDKGVSAFTLKLKLENSATFDKLVFPNGTMRLFCHAEQTIASIFHLFSTRHTERVTIGTLDEKYVVKHDQSWITPGGISEDEGVIPYTKQSFLGFRLLQEYFNFKNKFYFIDIHGLDKFMPPEGTTEFFIRIDFDRSYPEAHRLKKENIKLYCTPVVNLFEKDIVPVRVDHKTTEYRLVADLQAPQDFEVWDINEMVGIEEKTNRRFQYNPFFSFQKDEKNRFFYTKIRKAPSGQYDTYVSILGSDLDQELGTETLSISSLSTNRSLPREKLKLGEINLAPSGFPEVVTFQNITQPTLDRHPPREQNFFWKLLSHMSTNHMSIATPEAFKNLLKLYDWVESESNKKRIKGIRDVKWKPKERVYKGAIIRGSEVYLEIQDGSFSDEGDICLFGLVMSRFLSMYATINSFVYLTIKMMPSGKVYEWSPEIGVKAPI